MKNLGEKGVWPYPGTAQNCLLSQEREKLQISNLASTFRGYIRTKAHYKFQRKGSVGVSRDFPKFSGTPIIPGTGKATDFKFGQYIPRVHQNKSPLKVFGEKGAWVYPGTAQFFWVPPNISGTGKATDFKFSQYIQRFHRNKSP